MIDFIDITFRHGLLGFVVFLAGMTVSLIGISYLGSNVIRTFAKGPRYHDISSAEFIISVLGLIIIGFALYASLNRIGFF